MFDFILYEIKSPQAVAINGNRGDFNSPLHKSHTNRFAFQ